MSGQRLAGTKAIVTGGTRGIGKAIASAFLSEGATVAISGRTEDSAKSALADLSVAGQPVHALACDVTDPASVDAFVAGAVRALGGLDVLVNNAGAYAQGRFAELGDDDWTRTFEVNVLGTVRCTRAALPTLRQSPSGRVINLASTAGKYGSLYQSPYNASKHAVVGLTRCLALEEAGAGVRVNAVCPGFVETDLITDRLDTFSQLLGVEPDEVVPTLQQRAPIKRFVTPEEVAELTVYLASELADGMTGQAITLAGGLILV